MAKILKKLPINLNSCHILVLLIDILLDLKQLIVESIDEFDCIKKVLNKVRGSILNWHRYLIWDKIISPTVFNKVVFELIDDWKVGAVNF